MTVQDFVRKYGVSRRTVYRWLETGKIHAKKIDDKWDIDDDIDIDMTNDTDNTDTEQLLRQQIEQLQGENEYLRSKLDQIQEQAQEDRQRADTIILQLTKQFEQQTLMLEDMRNHSLWHRVKMIFAPSGG